MAAIEERTLLNAIDEDGSLERCLTELKKSKENNRPAREILNAYIRILEWFSYHQFWSESIIYVEEALDFRKQMDITEPKTVGRLFRSAGVLYIASGRSDLGGSYLLTARKVLLRVEQDAEKDLARCCSLLGSMFLAGDNLDKGKQFLDEALAYYCACSENDLETMVRVHKSFANLYAAADAYKWAVREYYKAATMQIRRMYSRERDVQITVDERKRCAESIRELFLRLGECHGELGHYYRALVYERLGKFD